MFGLFGKKADIKDIDSDDVVLVAQDLVRAELEGTLAWKYRRVVCFSKQKDAVASLQAGTPRAVVLQAELDQGSGYSVCNVMKKSSVLRTVPLVLFTTTATRATVEQHKRLQTRADKYVIGNDAASVAAALAELLV